MITPLDLSTLRQIINRSLLLPNKKITQRPHYQQWLEKSLKTDLVKIVTGFRRTGKSTLLKLLVKDLITNHQLPEQNIFYLNFELDIAHAINDIKKLRSNFELFIATIDPKHPVFVILDEVQKLAHWESFVRALHESSAHQIFVSGSNSELLSSELSSALGGRYIALHVLPFNFANFLDIVKSQDLEISQKDFYDPEARIYQLAYQFINQGGLPEAINIDESIADNYVENTFNKVVIDDIAQRYQVQDIGLLKNLYQFVLGNVTGVTSYNNLSQHLGASQNTIKRYLNFFMSAFSLYSIPKYGIKLYSVFEESKKYYAVDSAFFKLLSRDTSFNQKLENQVFIKLKQTLAHKPIFFGRDYRQHEIDFLIKEDEKKFTKVQVTNVLHEGNIGRELGNLKFADQYLSGRNILIYWNDARQNKEQVPGIEMLPAPKALLDGI